MKNEVSTLNGLAKLREGDIIKCNEFTKEYGLILSPEDVKIIISAREEALENNGRVEFGGSVPNKIIKKFCDSPYIVQKNYVEIITKLIDLFYYYKNETLELIGDDMLIDLMYEYFSNIGKGSLEIVERELDKILFTIIQKEKVSQYQ